MSLDPRYIAAFEFQEVLFDKDTGAPLAAGLVYAYRDTARNAQKKLYQLIEGLSGYEYVPLPNPVVLSAIGTFQDTSGNDIVPYYYPYDANGNLDLYFIKVKNVGDIEQFTRTAQPSSAISSQTTEDVVNYIPNGQFIIHNDILSTPVVDYPNQITMDVTDIAQGGWTYEKPPASTSIDILTFERFGSLVIDIPSGDPRYSTRIKCIYPSVSDAYKYLAINFKDVNKFASIEQYYTLSFVGKSNTGSSTQITASVRKHYGTGGSDDDIITVQTVTLGTSYGNINVPILFGDNSGETIGSDDTDFVSVVLELPPTFPFDLSLTDFVLSKGNNVITQFPVTTTEEFTYRSLAGLIDTPAYDNTSLYLPLMLTKKGLAFDTSIIGKTRISNTEVLADNELECDGSAYDTDGTDSRSGIPYRRLWNAWKTTAGYGLHGIPDFYVEFTLPPLSPTILLTAITSGYNLTIVDGSVPTGFTFAPLGGTYDSWNVTTIAGSSITNGSYFTFKDALHDYYVLMVSNRDTVIDPRVATHKRIIVDFLVSDTNVDIAVKLTISLNAKWILVPDYRGYFIRGWNHNKTPAVDPDYATRTISNPGALPGNHVGTYQQDILDDHDHIESNPGHHDGPWGRTQMVPPDERPSLEGGSHDHTLTSPPKKIAIEEYIAGTETRPKNIYVMFVVTY